MISPEGHSYVDSVESLNLKYMTTMASVYLFLYQKIINVFKMKGDCAVHETRVGFVLRTPIKL